MSSHHQNESAVPAGPQIAAETWFALAIASFTLTLLAFVCFGLWVFSGDGALMLQSSQTFTPFGAGLIAAVTFFTVAWRGVLNTRQLEYQAAQLAHQAEQLAQSRRQNDANDDANLAKLLQEGAKLLGERENQAHLLAGITSLHSLIVEPKHRYGVQAMDLLADFVSFAYDVVSVESALNAAVRSLAEGEVLGLRSNVGVRFRSDDANRRWFPVRGLAYAEYSGGRITHSRDEFMTMHETTVFNGVYFENCIISDYKNFRHCTFENCDIVEFSGTRLPDNRFLMCDFSNACISHPFFDEVYRLGEGSADNYFHHQQPPNGEMAFKWYEILSTDPKGDIYF